MNPSRSPRPAGPTRRWLLSLLATRPGCRLLHTALITTLALNMGGPVWAEGELTPAAGAGTVGNSGELRQGMYSVPAYQEGIGITTSIQNVKAKTANPYANSAVQNALWQLGLRLPSEQLAVGSEQLAVSREQFPRYAAGSLLAPDSSDQFQVNSYTTNRQRYPAVAVDSDGDFVVVWRSYGSSGSDTDSYSIQGQRYNSAGVSQGSQFQVNSYTTSDQFEPAVAVDSDGDFVVVWSSFGSYGSDDHYSTVQGQRYNSAGTAQGSQFQVNSYTTSSQFDPAVALDSDGDFVVVWNSYGSYSSDDDFHSIQGQRYNSAGTAQGSQFQVNSYTTGSQRYPEVAVDSDGDFVVVWGSYGSSGSDTDAYSIQGQRYNSAGTAQGSQFQVNSYTSSYQFNPAVAMDSDGDFVVVWSSFGSYGSDDNDSSVQGQRYNSAGTAQGSQFQVNSYTSNSQGLPAVAMDGDGDFAVAWFSFGGSGTDFNSGSIQGQRYNSAGTAQGSQSQVNDYTKNSQTYPAVALDSDGDFVIVWQSYSSPGDDSSFESIQACLSDSCQGEVELASQFQVNSYTTSSQFYPVVAIDSDGDFVVVWTSYGSYGSDNDGYSIQGQRYNSAGTAQGSQFQVNSYTTSDQRDPTVAMDGDGDFVVVWNSYGSAGSDTANNSIQGQRYNSAGVAQGSQFQVNSFTTNSQFSPAVAIDSDGDFVVVWNSFGSAGSDNNNGSIQGQRYNSAGTAQGSQFQVNSYTTNSQSGPAVAMDSDGDFVVVWQSLGSYGSDNYFGSIQAQRYNSAGTGQGSQFQVNSYTTSSQFNAAVAMDSDGDFVVVWQSSGSAGSDNDSTSIQGQRYNSAGTGQGSQFQVNSYTTSDQRYPAVAVDSDGDFVVVWDSYGSSSTDQDHSIQGRAFLKSGLPLWNEFQVNRYIVGGQKVPAVALDSSGDFVVAWGSQRSPGNDASSYSIQAGLFDLGQSDFLVNFYTTNNQTRPDVAIDDDGDFVIVWQSDGAAGGDTDVQSIQARLIGNDGSPANVQFQVNSYTTAAQRDPAVAMDSSGNFVIVWDSYGSSGDDNDGRSIQGQRYNSTGVAQGSQFQVNSYTTNVQGSPDVAMDNNGDFVVVWQSQAASGDTDSASVQGQRYNSSGTAQGSQFQVNSYTTNGQALPAVAMDSDGDFVVVWFSNGSSDSDTSYASIQGQRYNSSGTAQGSQFQVNSYTTSFQFPADVALDSDGDFVVVWESLYDGTGSDSANFSIQAQRYNSAGVALGSQFQVNSYTTSDQKMPKIAMDDSGDFVVVWGSVGSSGSDTSSSSVAARRFNQSGTAQGSDFQVNNYTSGSQNSPAVALDSDGDFVVAWDSEGLVNPPFLGPEGGGNVEVAASRFTALAGPEPTALTLQDAGTTLPVRDGLLAAAAGLWAAVMGWWLRRRKQRI